MNQLFDEMKKLILKQNDEEFEFFVNNHMELLKEDPVLFISNHVSYYAYQENVKKVLEVIERYKNMPYISMTVEDLLNELKENVEKLNQQPKTYSKEEISSGLKSKNEEKMIASLEYLSKLNIRSYFNEIKDFLLSEVPHKYKVLALYILIEQKYQNEVKFLKDGLTYTLNPSMLELPLETYEYQECVRQIQEEDIDPQVKEYAIEILNTIQIKEFPDSYLTLDNASLMKEIFIVMSKKYLMQDFDLNDIVSSYHISMAIIEELINELTQIVYE